MKHLALLITLTLLSSLAFTQNAFYDAQYLSSLSKLDLNKILSCTEYRAQKNTEIKLPPVINLSENEIKAIKDYIVFIDNPFCETINNLDIYALKNSIDKYNDALKNGLIGNGLLESMGFLSLIPSIIGGTFSLNAEQQTKIIDGLTKYYAEEFRKAQMITYMQTFESTIDKVGELQVLLPQTYAKLRNADPSRFPELGDEYKAIFNEDLKSILDNIIYHIDNYEESIPKNHLDSTLKYLNKTNVDNIRKKESYQCLKISMDIGSKLINNYHPVDLMNFLDNKYYFNSSNQDQTTNTSNLLKKTFSELQLHEKIILTIHGLNLIQKNVLDTAQNKNNQFANIWLNLQDLNKLDSEDEWVYFAGLIYQQDREFFNKYIFNASGKDKSTVSNSSDLFVFRTSINTILSSLVEIQNFSSNLNEESLKDNFAGYMNLYLKSFESANLKSTSLHISANDLNKYLTLADYTMKIYDNVRKKDYNNTIYYTVEIFNQLFPLVASNTNTSYTEFIANFEQYGSFAAAVINTKNSDEVKDVIKKYAAPPASFILKREYARTFSITGQPGYFISTENLEDNWAFVSGITLPMGFEYSFKLKKGQKNSSSLGIFAQIIDLGAMLNFRVSDSTSTLPDKVEFSQIFSPGGSLTYGFKNSPLTLGIGYQYTPELRKITLENGNEIYPNGHRVFFRLAWDIPFLNIWKSKEK